jgi:hypothetical protein
MKTLKIKGTEYHVRNEAKEVTLEELAKISSLLDSEGDFTDKWLRVIEILGGREIIEVLTSKQFVDLVGSIQITDVTQSIQETIEIGGRIYKCNLENNELQLSAKDMSMLERMVAKGGVWGSKAFAVVYKDEDLTNNEHYTDAHIKHKSELFGKHVTADIAAPVIFHLSKLVVEHIQALIDAQNPSVPTN